MGFPFGSATPVSSFFWWRVLLVKLHHRRRAEIFAQVTATSCPVRLGFLVLIPTLMVRFLKWQVTVIKPTNGLPCGFPFAFSLRHDVLR
jgi:hypothetical protein